MIRIVGLLLFTAATCISQVNGFATSSDGVRISYRVYGLGSPLLIINGGPGMNSNGFEGLAQKLSDHYQCVIYDQRGTGKSVLNKLNGKTITMKLMLDDAEAIRTSLGFAKWDILGHSFGGMVASYYAATAPEHIGRIILSSSGGIDLGLFDTGNLRLTEKLTPAQRDSLAYWESRISSGDQSHAARLGRGRALAPAYVVNPKFIPVIAERLTQSNAQVNGLIWADMRKTRFDCTKKLKGFRNPVLILQGENDILSTKVLASEHEAFANSKVIILPHSAHYGWLDAPDEYFGAVYSFLATS